MDQALIEIELGAQKPIIEPYFYFPMKNNFLSENITAYILAIF